MADVDRVEIEAWFRELQDSFTAGIERFDGRGVFTSDCWDRPGGGGGDTRVLADGHRIEKAAVNVSAVWGEAPERFAQVAGVPSATFHATGVSIIVHPHNPHAPTFHANLRYFEVDDGVAWFGGGADLTPHYLYAEDAHHFHGVIKACCDRHRVADHAAWKTACDEYFFLPHRGEARGVGGIFFDRLTDDLPDVWAFSQDLGKHLVDAYVPILERRSDMPYGDDERRWQELRRGRYAEFNLVWDRGTKFGLETGGRIESILASLPPRARWEYAAEPPDGTAEAAMVELLRGEPRTWA